LFLLLVICQCAVAQAPAADQAAYKYPCGANAKNLPGTFSGFWTPKPHGIGEVEVRFETLDSNKKLSCTGEPLEITVPNGQAINLTEYGWDASCKPTLAISPALADNPVGDLLTMATKLGSLGLDAQGYIYELPKLRNKILTITVECTPAGYKQTQVVKITYQNPPRLAVSGGLLVSTHGVKSYGIQTVKTGTGAGGVATTQSSIAVTGSSSAQVIPFGFANLYWLGTRKLNLSTQFGVGVNPNLSTARVEYFAAPVAFAWKDFYFAPGVHIGQHEVLTGGFAVGDITTLSKPPIKWGYKGSLGFSLSYNLKPLVKSGSK
jgi:hypothetical protein